MSFPLQHIAHGQPFYGHMFFMDIAVKRSLPRDVGGHVLHVVKWSCNHGLVGFGYPDVVDVDILNRALVGETNHAETLHAGVRLNAYTAEQVALVRAFVLEGRSEEHT